MTLVAIIPVTLERSGRGEFVDALDVNWAKFFCQIGIKAVVLPNLVDGYGQLLERIKPDGVLLSGGGDIAALSGSLTERDVCERIILDWAISNKRPVFGICRGFQVILARFGAEFRQSKVHVRTRHEIVGLENRQVNSYHHYVAVTAPKEVMVWARAKDASIEAASFLDGQIKGVMWHPERSDPFDPEDLQIMKSHFGARI
ncbi:gamma-glutamyl-gamma-aminobutyrate hydrolase family protein [Thalassospira lucentensis]|uniref:gamma-glutamyl-gamma-aminobutyrate hydrolase family protein n=1 Tax=Thalassospira lucentensis TaxID=168935 RepID=UPI0003B5E574|nr:gamma-glutamyl-gamma-aminobutyrate hydrolase family protein [Thalassospira lucentensis]RCK18821.1 hypothetical protein TH1_22185 [Thalassospira lucentensis MCCC 1A00383 = DSM 14000]